MKLRFSKPALVAGFSFLLTAPAFGQNYIDVEAEREAARRAREAQRTAGQPSVLPGQSGAAAVDGSAAAQTPDAPATSSSYGSYGGIRPYSGTTRVVAPSDVTPAAVAAGGAPSNTGDLVLKLQQLEADVRRLNGLVEEQAAALRRLEEQSFERYVDIDRRLAGGVAPADVMSAGDGAVLRPSEATATESGQSQPGEEAAYNAAYDLVRNQQFTPAMTAFQRFLTDYPFGRYAPNAHYWLGELYLVIQPPDPELARQSFKLLLDQYPTHAKIPDAMYKLGRVHYLKGNRERSREYLDRVVDRYGAEGHPAAQLARDFIADNF